MPEGSTRSPRRVLTCRSGPAHAIKTFAWVTFERDFWPWMVHFLKGETMSETRHELTFLATDEAGQVHKILVFQDIATTKLNNRSYDTRGPLRLCTINGESVRILGQGKYEIVGGSGSILTTTDSGAPGYRNAAQDEDWTPLD